MTHTPGPWRRNVIMTTHGGKSEHLAIESMHDPKFPHGYVLARVYKERDASVIAAAPDMLAALKNIVESLEWFVFADGRIEHAKKLAEAKVIISKAEGNR